MANYPEKVYLNGEIINAKDAKISVFDRGFLFGDGVYEVMLQINEHFFFGKEHLARLKEGLYKINIEFDVHSLPPIITKLLECANLAGRDCMLYIQVTRGVAPRKHAFPKDVKPSVVLYAIPFILPSINTNNVSAITHTDFRWHRCDIKMTSLLGNVMANNNAVKNGHYETIFHRDGLITEASHCNIFFVKDDIVYTHPADQNILNGITRQIVLQLCQDHKIAYKEEAIALENINQMDEAFLTGTSTQIASIQQIDDHRFYSNNIIPKTTQLLQELFRELKGNYVS